MRDSGFNSIRMKVEDRQARLERHLVHQTHKSQVELALQMLSGIREEEDQVICVGLVRRGYFANWSQAQREYFDDAAAKLTGWSDFFLSFTSFNPSTVAPSLVNNDHKILLSHQFGKTFRPPDTVERNLLALLLHSRLSRRGCAGSSTRSTLAIAGRLNRS